MKEIRDCFFLVADKNMESLLKGFLLRENFHLSLGCGFFQFDAKQDLLVAHGQNDSGLYIRAHTLLGSYQRTHRHAVVILDAEWEGSPGAEAICERMNHHFQQTGWSIDAICVVVIEPELENWIWQDTPYVCTTLGYSGSFVELRSNLEKQGFWPMEKSKPKKPKESVEWVLRNMRKPRSSSIYHELATRISVKRCTDNSFQTLRSALQRWFPEDKKVIGAVMKHKVPRR